MTGRTDWRPLPTVFGLASALLFGLATPASKILLGDIHSFLLAGLLYAGAAIGVLPLLLREKTLRHVRRNISKKQYGYIVGAIICGGFAGPVLLLLGLQSAHASSVAIWLNMELVATAILGVFIFRDHLDTNGWIAVAMALLAGGIMTASEGQSGVTAALLVTLACICWGFDNHFTALIDCLTPARITLLKGVFAGSVNTAIGFILTTTTPQLSVIAKALILGALAYGASIVLYVISAQQLGATRGQILFSCSPFFAVILSAILLNEQLTFFHLSALCCLTGAIFFANRITHSHQHSHQEMSHTHLHDHDDGHHHHDHSGISARGPHSHTHHHQATTHNHPHYPDLHHRHEHNQ